MRNSENPMQKPMKAPYKSAPAVIGRPPPLDTTVEEGAELIPRTGLRRHGSLLNVDSQPFPIDVLSYLYIYISKRKGGLYMIWSILLLIMII